MLTFAMLIACTPKTVEPSTTAMNVVEPTPTDRPDPVPPMTPEERPAPGRLAADDPGWNYQGRIDHQDPSAPLLIWSGSRIEGTIDATSITAHLEATGETWINVYLDGGLPTVVRLEEGLRDVTIGRALAPGPHTLRITKRTEATDGTLRFHGVTADGTLRPMAEPPFGIEFYGDSITSSYSIECACDEGLPRYKNFDQSYGALTAAAFGAEARAISLSGIGIVRSWWAEDMLDHWNGLQLGDGAWDFFWQPEVVVVNLGQNDYWLGADAKVRSGYTELHGELRAVYPDADILFALGDMNAVASDSPMPGYVRDVVDALTVDGDARVHALVFDYNGHGRHPEVADHRVMADALIAKIREIRPDLAPQ
ncbi:MAG: GDSL-type esterase/lipase family protein [Myxococcota bacterium]